MSFITSHIHLGRKLAGQFFYVISEMPKKRMISSLRFWIDSLLGWDRLKIHNNKSFCILPWIHLYIGPSGDAHPCCVRQPNSTPLGSLRQQELKEIWNSAATKKFRKDLREGRQRPEICQTCYAREKNEGTSHRLEFNRKFYHHIKPRLQQTREDGELLNDTWVYWDFRLSNKCNFKCRTCGPKFSTAWQQENKVFFQEESEKFKPYWKQGFEYLIQNAQNIEEIYFAGGEPLIIDEHYQLLQWLIAQKKTHVVLSYNTNMSVLKYKEWDIIELWSQFDHVYVSPSLDHFGKKAEYIRKGTRFETLLENLLLLQEKKNIQLRPTMTLSNLNIADFPEIHEFYLQKGLIKDPNHFAANILREPNFYHMSVLPTGQKQKVLAKIRDYNTQLQKTYAEGLYCLPLLEEELQKDGSALIDKFIYQSQNLDKIRDENLSEVLEVWRADHAAVL